jgi:hypothetical protein
MSTMSLFLTVHCMHYTWFHQKETDLCSYTCHLNYRMDFYIYIVTEMVALKHSMNISYQF